MANLPYFNFYKGDFLRGNVSACSIAAQGLWLRIMILMHDSERTGYLCLNGKPIPSRLAAVKCAVSVDEYETLLAELMSVSAFNTSRESIIFSPELVAAEEGRSSNAERQRRFKAKQKGNGKVTGEVTEEKRVSSSSSSSSEKNKPNGLSKSACVSETADPEESEFTEKVIGGIKERLRVTFSLPDENGWYQSAIWAYVNGYTPEQFLACYDHLKSQTWREGRVTAKNVEGNLPDYVLDAETATAEYINPLTGRGLK